VHLKQTAVTYKWKIGSIDRKISNLWGLRINLTVMHPVLRG